MSLGRIVQQRRGQQVRVVLADRQEPIDHVERVPPIGDGHAVEQPGGPRRQDAVRERPFLVADPRPQVRGELTDPMHR